MTYTLWTNSNRGKASGGPLALAVSLLLLMGLASAARAQDLSNYSMDNYSAWLSKYADAKPDFKPGDVLTQKDLERLRPFVPPGYFEQLNFPELRVEIANPSPHPMNRVYQNCTEKYGPQVRLASDGALVNYLCGQPFLNSDLSPSDPLSGIKAAWNFDYHWDYYGLNGMLIWVWDRMGGNHQGQAPNSVEAPPPSFIEGINYVSPWPSDIASDFGGGGTFQRTLQSYYQRAKFSHLAQLADQGGLVPLRAPRTSNGRNSTTSSSRSISAAPPSLSSAMRTPIVPTTHGRMYRRLAGCGGFRRK